MLLRDESVIRDLQDAWSVLYAVAAEKLLQFYGRPGVVYLRKSIKTYGYRLGEMEKGWTRGSGARVNLHQLFWNNHVQIPDPRFKIQVQFITEEAAVYDVIACPIFFRLRAEGREALLLPYCEEFSRAFDAACYDGYGQCNLSEIMTQPGQMSCCFSEYFRKTNVPEDRHKECFSDDPPHDPFQEGARRLLAIPDTKTSCTNPTEAAAMQTLLFWESAYRTLCEEKITPRYNNENAFFSETLRETCARHLEFWKKRASNDNRSLNRGLPAANGCLSELRRLAQGCRRQPLLSGLDAERAAQLYDMVDRHYLNAIDRHTKENP